MALKARITAAEYQALAEALRKEYKADGDAFIIDVVAAEGYDLQNIAGLTSALSKLKGENSAQKAQLKAFEVDGEALDPVAAAKALKRVTELEALDPKKLAEEQVKSALEQAKVGFQKELGAVKARAELLEGNLRGVMVDQVATAALAAKGGNVKLLLPHVRSALKMVEEDGKFKVKVLGADGNPRIVVANGSAVDMTIEDLVGEMAGSQDFGAAFSAKGAPGPGGKPSDGSGAPPGSARVVRASDSVALQGASLADIAAGKVTVDLNS